VVLSGNNEKKTRYIHDAIAADLHVLADKPMAIEPGDFGLLRKSFARAAKEKVLLYDIMTERYEITSILQREFARNTELFGKLERGSAESPAILMQNVHHYFKEVSGKPLIRPAWFFDVRQQGEAIPDVGTHLVDLIQWQCFPEQVLDYKKDIKVYGANRWATILSREQFKKVTNLDEYPDYLKRDVKDGALHVYQNGDVSYTIKGVHAKVTALWNFEPPPGAKDTHYSMFRGTKASLTVKQGAEQKYLPVLFIEDRVNRADFEKVVRSAGEKIAARWPGMEVKPASVGGGFEVVVPEKYVTGHEAHFAEVTQRFLEYLQSGKMPEWEVPNMVAKYYTTLQAYKLSH
jgi:predicted dehydrogenase